MRSSAPRLGGSARTTSAQVRLATRSFSGAQSILVSPCTVLSANKIAAPLLPFHEHFLTSSHLRMCSPLASRYNEAERLQFSIKSSSQERRSSGRAQPHSTILRKEWGAMLRASVVE